MRPPNGNLAKVVSRCNCHAYAEAPRQARRSPHSQRAIPAKPSAGPQYLNKNPLMFIHENLTISNVEAGAGNPVCSARLA